MAENALRLAFHPWISNYTNDSAKSIMSYTLKGLRSAENDKIHLIFWLLFEAHARDTCEVAGLSTTDPKSDNTVRKTAYN